MDKYEAVLVEISKLELGENDYLVFKFSDDTSPEAVKDMAQWLRNRFSSLVDKIMLIVGDVELYVVHREDK